MESDYLQEHCIDLETFAKDLRAGSFSEHKYVAKSAELGMVKGKLKLIFLVANEAQEKKKVFVKAVKQNGKTYLDTRSIEYQKRVLNGGAAPELDIFDI